MPILGIQPPQTDNDMSKENFSFEKGWSQLPIGYIEECRNRLMEAFGITTRAAFCKRRNGDVEPRMSQIKAVEDIFADYGIKDVWGRND